MCSYSELALQLTWIASAGVHGVCAADGAGQVGGPARVCGAPAGRPGQDHARRPHP